jgi:purine-binding chemotaxis protein CheW
MSTVQITKEITHERTFQIVVFKLGTEEYALPIDQIKEVVPTPAITKMPQTTSCIKGVANIRGNIIAILNLADRLGLSGGIQPETIGKYTLVVESEEFKMGILVQEVPNTLPISESAIDQSVFNSEGDHSYIKGIVKLKDRLIILMDIFRVMSLKELNTSFQKQSA